MKFLEKLKNLAKIYLTSSQQEREISKSREILPLPNREMKQISTTNQKTTSEEMVFGASTGARLGIVNRDVSIATEYILSSPIVDNPHEAVEVPGVEPGRHGLTIPATRPATPTADSLYQEKSVLSLNCPYCSSEDFVKRGSRQKKKEKVQLYLCKSCTRTFTPVWFKGRQHNWQTILEAMSYYNLGFSLAQTCDVMKKKFNIEIQPSTLSSWMERHRELCAYSRMRSFAIKHFSPYEVIDTATLAHRQLYRFRYHRAKTKYILEDDFKHYKFYPLKEFLENVSGECPHQYFQEGLRASEAPLKFSKIEMIVRSKENYATKLAKLVFQGVADNKQRHEALQRFFIANDSVTVATEVPVYIRKEDLEHMQTQLGFKIFSQENKKEMREIENEELPKLITGHIDFLQIRNGSIHILDYKANAAKERPIEQLTLYALALSRLTGIRVFHFKCAWFDEKDYFEFFPLHVVYKPRRGCKKVYTKEGEYDINQRVDRIEHLGPNWTKKSKLKPPF